MNNWRKYNGALIPLTPPHIEVDVTGIEKKIQEEDAYFSRWTTNFDCKEETEFWYVICDNKLELTEYSRNTRSKIKRGLKNCDVRRVDKSIILKDGYVSYFEAFKNYNTNLNPKTIEEFHTELKSLGKEWEFWGIYYNEKMIGYSQNKITADYCDYSTIKFNPEYLRYYPSYALFFIMNKYYLIEKNYKYVNDGARSISHETNIQSFLIDKFRFRKAYCKLNVIYSPKVKLLLSLFYPFRLIIKLLKFGPFVRLNILFNQEKIRRSYE
jgi:hypothetical protein